MSNPILYKGRGTPEMYDDLMDFLNYVFGFNGDDRDFKKLLPKCYKREYDPCWSNYVVTEDGRLKAAVGAYDTELSVNGEVLKVRGIGNVAVHPYARSRGFMKDCMNMALSDMVADGVDFSALGGQRQRYQHFGYDHGGVAYSVSVDQGNLRRAFEGVPLVPMELYNVTEADGELIEKMAQLHDAQPVHAVRPREKFFDVARSWRTSVTAVLKNGDFRGYFVGDLNELNLTDPADLTDVVRNYVAQRGGVTIQFAPWKTDAVAIVASFGGSPSCHPWEMFSIFNYTRVIGALLRFKATFEELGDGELTLLIHGFAGDETVRIAVKSNDVTVEKTNGKVDLELGHIEALSFLTGVFSARRMGLSPAPRSWFPLPLFMDRADHV